MAFSSARYTGDGVTKDFTVTFDYLDQSHVKARVNKVFTDAVGSNYKITWINPTTLRVDTVIDGNAPLAGEEIELIRQTPIDSPAVVFGGGASLSSENLNKNSEYLTYALQEATDDNEAFTKLYLGSADAFPTTDNDGEALQVGSVIYYTPENALYYYTSLGTWVVGESTIAAQQFRDQAEAARDIAVTAQAGAESAKSGAESAQVAAAASAVTASGHATTAGLEKDAAVVAKDAALAALAASDRQPLDATLTLLSGKTVTAAGLALLDDASAGAQRTTLGLGNIATTNLIDEDDMASDLDTRAPTQQSVKAYVDGLTTVYEDGEDATTSGTAHDFTGIPADVNEIEILLDSVSVTGTNDFLIQIGTGGTPTTTGYFSISTNFTANSSSTSGFVMRAASAATTFTTTTQLRRVPGTNKWVATHIGASDGVVTLVAGSGYVTLSGTLDNIRLTRTGADTFDAGAWSIRCRK